MDVVIFFFRDTLSGWLYFLYVVVCLVLIFSMLGKVAEKSRSLAIEKLKAEKRRQLESGEAALKASMEGKQIINVLSEVTNKDNTLEISASPDETLGVIEIKIDSTGELVIKDAAPVMPDVSAQSGQVVQVDGVQSSAVSNIVETNDGVEKAEGEDIGMLVINSDN